MSVKFKAKILLDILMTALMLPTFAYHLTGNSNHEWLGFGFILALIIHQILNVNWYRSLAKGKYSSERILLSAINFLLLLSVIFTAISGIGMSREVFTFLPRTKNLMLYQHIHMTATSWMLILASCHLGLHWNIFANLLGKFSFMRSFYQTPLPRLFAAALIGFGLYCFYTRRFPHYMFLQMEYPAFDFYETMTVFIVQMLAIVGAFTCICYYLRKLLHRTKRRVHNNHI